MQDRCLLRNDKETPESMPLTLTVLSRANQERASENTIKLARFMGLAAIEYRRMEQGWLGEGTRPYLSGKRHCLVANASELMECVSRREDLQRLRTFLFEGRHALFLYGFSCLTEESSFLKELTSGAVVSCNQVRAANRCYGVHFDCLLTARHHVDDLSFRVEESTKAVIFELGEIASCANVMMTLDGKPFLTRLRLGDSTLYLAGCNEIANLDDVVPKEVSLLSYFSSVVPLMAFLREVFRERCWHSDSPRACLIVDDPLLRMNYGFINYGTLLEVMRRRNMSTCIAFIPWNFRRTSNTVAQLFLSYPERCSLSIHGCDHTWAEFGSSDEPLLRYKVIKAKERMSVHQRLSGLPFDEVMVFPQGVFSLAAMKALKACGYLAAVNSTPYPVDAEDYSLTLRELLDVAIMRYSNFPLFIRRYPNNPTESFFDLFLGKPLLLVEHHTYFRNGYNALTELADKLNAFDERLQWTSLGEISSRSCIRRVVENGDVHVKFYADRFWLKNDTDRSQNYVLFWSAASEVPLTDVRVNGRHVNCARETDVLKILLSLNPGETAEVKVKRDKCDESAMPLHQGRIHDSRVFVRRFLSEFRDNYVHKHWFLAKVASKARGHL